MEKFITCLTKMKEIAYGLAGDKFISEVSELHEKLMNERIFIVVTGLFKRGKSSLLNTLLGFDILPVAVTPLTAIITIIEFYDGDPFAEVQFQDGRFEIIPVGSIPSFVSEDENPVNRKQVSAVRIYMNAPILKYASLVDTPGLGSAYEHNSNTTKEFFPKIDAALIVLSADMPISRMELDYLNKLKVGEHRLFFVLNKIDLLEENDLLKMLTHNKTIIAAQLERCSDEIEVFTVSARYPELKLNNRGMEELKQAIANVGLHEKESLLLKSAQRQYTRLKTELISLLRLKRELITLPVVELEKRRLSLQQSIKFMEDQKPEFENLIAGRIKKLRNKIEEEVNSETNRIRVEVFRMLNDHVDQLTDNAVLRNLQSELDRFILDKFTSLKEKMEHFAREGFASILHEYSFRSQSFFNELIRNLSSMMGVGLEMFISRFDLGSYSPFYITLSSDKTEVDSGLTSFLRILPKSWRQKVIFNRLEMHYREVLIRNTAAIGYDLQYKIQESFRQFKYELELKTADVLQSIEKMYKESLVVKEETDKLLAERISQLDQKINLLKETELSL